MSKFLKICCLMALLCKRSVSCQTIISLLIATFISLSCASNIYYFAKTLMQPTLARLDTPLLFVLLQQFYAMILFSFVSGSLCCRQLFTCFWAVFLENMPQKLDLKATLLFCLVAGSFCSWLMVLGRFLLWYFLALTSGMRETYGIKNAMGRVT